MITSRIWEGETVVILGGGPSLTRQDVDYCKGKAKVVAVNNAYLLAPWADLLYACDFDWWALHHIRTNAFSGQKWTCSKDASDKYGLNLIGYNYASSVSFTPGLIHLGGTNGPGGNSGFQALNLAVLFGAKRILLLGFDMGTQPHKTHWHDGHPGLLDKASNYAEFIAAFDSAFYDLHKAGINVINCSRASKLLCFRKEIIANVI